MSKDKKRLVPVRRFKEFENAPAWEQRKLGEVGKTQSGIGFPNQEQGGHQGIPFFKVSDMNNEGNEFEMKISNNYVTEIQITNRKWKPISEVPAVIFAKVGAALMLNRKRLVKVPFLIDNNTMAYIFNKKWDPYFGKTLFDTLNLPRYAQIGALPSFNGSDIENIKAMLPSLEEQQVLSQFFQNIDTLIALHQRKLDKLKRVKSAYLTEMFPAEGEREPKRRFPGFTVAWEQRKFFDNIEKVIDFRGRTPKKLGMEWSAEGYTALSALNVKDGYIDFTADVHYANQDLYDKWMVGNDLYKGQVLFTTEAPMGNVAQVPDNRKYVLSQRTIAFNVDKTKVTNDFLAVLLRSQNVQHTLKSLASGGTAQGVSQKSLSQLKVIVPINPKEQQKIGDFFKQLDSLIALHQRKLDKLKKMKAAYLEEMFV